MSKANWISLDKIRFEAHIFIVKVTSFQIISNVYRSFLLHLRDNLENALAHTVTKYPSYFV
jgi:hypothetical protein